MRMLLLCGLMAIAGCGSSYESEEAELTRLTSELADAEAKYQAESDENHKAWNQKLAQHREQYKSGGDPAKVRASEIEVSAQHAKLHGEINRNITATRTRLSAAIKQQSARVEEARKARDAGR